MSQNRTIRRIKLKNNRPGRILVLGVAVRVLFLVLIFIPFSNWANGFEYGHVPNLEPRLAFWCSCHESLVIMKVEQEPESKTNQYIFREIYKKADASCNRSRDEYERDGWKDMLKHPYLSGCAEAILYAYHNKTDKEIANLTLKWCNGRK